MKRFLAVVLAVVFIGSTFVLGFSADKSSFNFVPVHDFMKQFCPKNNKFVFPCYISSPSVEKQISDFFDLYNDVEHYFRLFQYNVFGQGRSNSTLYLIPKEGCTYGAFNKGSDGYYYGFFNENYSSVKIPYMSFQYDPDLNYFSYVYINLSGTDIVYLYRSKFNDKKDTYCCFLDDSLFSVFPDEQISSLSSNCNFVTGISDISVINYKDYSPVVDCTLTINYQYFNGAPAADSVTRSLAPGAEYSIPSPEVPGYTPDIPLVTGTMPEEDLTVTVTYTKAFYPLTIQYRYADGSQAAESVSFQYPLGFAYDIPSPEIPGYRPDKPAIAGEMPGEALEAVVTYSAIPYTLTVRYRFLDGSQAAPDYQEQLIIGSSYFVASPEIAGYHPNQTAVSGVMPAGDVISTVTYREDSGGETPDPGGGEEGPGEGGGEGPGGGSLGDDPFGIPVQPPFSGYDPFKINGLPSWSGNDPFKIDGLPPYSYDPFVVPKQ